ncbi:anthrone oxygenase family protein [Amycolatopsis sp. NPDC059027]|uniref:anthrone oxygenase family protein n=1 Tax=unclassified Amycolatopsis TaxID=2618356 RepID=UPI00366E57CF
MFTIVVPLVLLANGLAAGVLVGTWLGGWPLLADLPPDRYVHAHAFFATRYDPFMPGCLLVATAGDVVLGVLTGTAAARLAYLGAAALCAVTIAISLAKNVPVNKWVRSLDPDRLPANFAELDPRPRWGAWNRVRTALSTSAFLLNCAALPLVLAR